MSMRQNWRPDYGGHKYRMVYVRRRVARRNTPRPAPRLRSSRPRVGRKSTVSEFAGAKQTISLEDDFLNSPYELSDVNLSQFDRLTNIAKNYQFFRFTKIHMKFKPAQDTFVANGERVPYLYYVIDKGENLNIFAGALGFNQLRDAGAKAIRFDDKSINVAWKPKVPVATASDSSGVPPISYAMTSRTSPWLPTNAVANTDPLNWIPSTIPHKGILYGVEANTLMSERTYNVEITVEAQFKKPSSMVPLGVEAIPATHKKVVAKEEVLTTIVVDGKTLE